MLTPVILHKLLNALIPDYSLLFEQNKTDMRLRAQKLMYLFQMFSGIAPYDFSWYFSGPYCSDLSYQIDAAIAGHNVEQSPDYETLVLTDAATAAIQKVHALMVEARAIQPDVSDSALCQLLAASLYILHSSSRQWENFDRARLTAMILKEIRMANNLSTRFAPIVDLAPYIGLTLDHFAVEKRLVAVETVQGVELDNREKAD